MLQILEKIILSRSPCIAGCLLKETNLSDLTCSSVFIHIMWDSFLRKVLLYLTHISSNKLDSHIKREKLTKARSFCFSFFVLKTTKGSLTIEIFINISNQRNNLGKISESAPDLRKSCVGKASDPARLFLGE